MKQMRRKIAVLMAVLMVMGTIGIAPAPERVCADGEKDADRGLVQEDQALGDATGSAGRANQRNTIRFAENEDKKYQGFTYVNGDDQGITIKGYSGVEKNIVIPDRIENRKVTRIAHEAFKNSDITGVTIPEGMNCIEEGAFYNCTYLNEIYFNATNCVCTYGYVDDGYNCIFHNAGMNSKTGLKVVFGDAVQIIPYDIFRTECYVTKIELSNKTTDIGQYAFCGCKILEEIIIPDSTSIIREYAFCCCEKLKIVNMGNSVKSIGEQAFSGSGIESIVIPETVSHIGKYAFGNCSFLNEITFNATDCECVYGYVGDGYNCIFHNVGINSNGLKVIFGDSVKTIPADIFRTECYVTEIKISEKTTTIGHSAFCGCGKLEQIQIPEGVTTIGDNAFSGCGKLKSVELKDGLKFIGERTFNGIAIENIAIPTTVSHIGKYAFGDCCFLNKIKINATDCECVYGYVDDGYNCIFHDAGMNSKGLKMIFDDTVKIIPSSVLRSECYVTDIEILSGVKEIGDNAFSGCYLNKLNVHFPSSIEKTGEKIFHEKTVIDVLYYEGTEAEFNISPIKEAVSNIEVKKYVFNSKPKAEEKNYVVTFDANGGSCSTATKSVQENGTIGSLPQAAREGYTFAGWYTDRTNGTKVDSSLTVTGNMTVYAHWEAQPQPDPEDKKTYTLTFDANGGSCSTATKSVQENGTIGSLPQAAREGYTFAGWYTDRTNGTKVDSSLTVTGNMTVYAHWETQPQPDPTTEPTGKITPFFDNERYTREYNGKSVTIAELESGLHVKAMNGNQTVTPEGTFRFVNGSIIPRNAGTYDAAVRFTPRDTEKYEAVEGTIPVTIQKKSASFYLSVNGKKDSLKLSAGNSGLKVTLKVDGLADGDNLFPQTRARVSGVPTDMNVAGVYTIRWNNASDMLAEIKGLSSAQNYNFSVNDSFVLEIVSNSSNSSTTNGDTIVIDNNSGGSTNNKTTDAVEEEDTSSEIVVSGRGQITIGKNRYSYGDGTATLLWTVSKAEKYRVASWILVDGKKYKVTTVGENAFYGSKKLKTVYIPSSVKKIKSGAFRGCSNLKTIHILGNVTSVGKKSFKGIKKGAKFKIYVSKKKYKKMVRKLKKAGAKNSKFIWAY